MSRPADSTLQDEPPGGASTPPRAAWLRVIACPERERLGLRVPLTQAEPLLIGRKVERGGLRVEDPKLSRVHARVVWDGRVGAFRVGDENSANGTAVDGRRIAVATLQHGSVLRAGDTVLVFVENDPVEELEDRLARAAPTTASVLLLGETGTGKELAAQRLHDQSGRPGPFVAVNTAALPRDLIASELFGHVRGAFSGAGVERAGLFRSAHRGTLFLDEIGDFPPELQPALLRVLEQRAVRAVGSEREVPVDLRIVSATHQDLAGSVARGEFRLDLYARLAALEIRVPALRERVHTLPELLESLARSHGIEELAVSADAMQALALGRWDQNIRGLKNLLERLIAFGTRPHALDLTFLEREAPELARARESAPPAKSGAPPATSSAPRSQVTREELERALEQHGGRVADVAAALGTSRTQVYRWLERFGIAPPQRK
ncbi:MAG TPA: sigma 54-interacting transcriptional regulator [Polyangiaceae bacterium]